MDTQKFKNIFAKALQIREGDVVDTASPATIPSWDSFNALILISELEKGFAVKFTMEEAVGIKNVGGIKKILLTKGVRL